TALLGLRFQDLEDQFLLAHAGRAGHVEVFRDLRELLDALVLQLRNVQAGAAALTRALAVRSLPAFRTRTLLALTAFGACRRLSGAGRGLLARRPFRTGRAFGTVAPVA